MAKKAKPLIRFALALLLFTATVSALPLVLGSSTDVLECVEAAAWVNDNISDLPTTLDELSSFPVTYRKAIQMDLEPAVRADLWRDHVQSYLSQHPELNQEQAAILREAIRLITPGLYEVSESDILYGVKVVLPLLPIKDHAKATFDPVQYSAIFTTLGPAAPTYFTLSAAKIWLTRSLGNLITSVHAIDCPEGWDECGCNSSGSCCNGEQCVAVPCGFFGTTVCDGCLCDCWGYPDCGI